MRTGIALFVYNRPEHTKKVLDGLKKNNIRKLYIFHDGLKNEEHRNKWEEVKNLINSINWCEIEVIFSKVNKGLAESVVYGVKYVLSKHERIIVLEDDCIPSQDFVGFMEKCFDRYESEESVMSVSGYSHPINIPQNYQYDIYFCHRCTSWGWGTWRRAWSRFERNYNVLKKINNSQKLKNKMELCGNDLTDMLKDQLEGKVDSWAIFWTLNIVENDGICINSTRSLIKNVGFDGTGVNCGCSDKYDTELNCMDISKIKFPKNVECDVKIQNKLLELWKVKTTEEILTEYYNMCTKWVKNLQDNKKIYQYLKQKNIDKVLIYGAGKIGRTLFDEIYNKGIILKGFIDNNAKQKEYKNVPIINLNKLDINRDSCAIIVTPIWDFDNIVNLLKSKEINCLILSLKDIVDNI